MDQIKHTKICLFSLTISMVAITAAFILCGVLPPQSPADGSAAVAEWYAANTTRIQIGAVLGTIGGAFYAPFTAAMAWEVKRLTGNDEAAYVQIILGVVATLGFFTPFTSFMSATFRPDRPADITHALYDSAWLPLYTVSAAFGVQFAFLAWAMLKERATQVTYPRWFAQFTVFTGVIQMFGLLVVFTKTGPFAWNGVLGFWIPFVVFGVWSNLLMRYWTPRLKVGASVDNSVGDATGAVGTA